MNNLDARYNDLFSNYLTIISNTKDKVESLVSDTFNNLYLVKSFSKTHLEIKVNTNDTDYRSVSIYHGFEYDWANKTNKFIFDMNISGCGSFNMLGEDDSNSGIHKYYLMIANILSNKEFMLNLKNMLYDMATNLEPINDEMLSVRAEKRAIEDAIAKEHQQKVENEKYLADCKMLANAKPDDYVLIKKGSGKFIYRNAPVSIIYISSKFDETIILRNKYNKTGGNYTIVNACKIKK